MTLMKIAEVNNLNSEDFISVFGNVVEEGMLCAVAVWKYRPFRDINHIHFHICQFLDELPNNDKKKLLRGLPDLAGRLTQSGRLSSESTKEQRSAGLNTLSPEEQWIITESNSQYREKFGFPFVVCARQNTKNAILKGLKARLQNDQLKELHTGVEEVKKICWLRLLDIVKPVSKM